jgi:hypothetical protein
MVRVSGDGSAPYCDLWLCKSLPTVSGFQPTPELAYPFTPGQLIGVARFAKKGTDFRDQEIRPASCTLHPAAGRRVTCWNFTHSGLPAGDQRSRGQIARRFGL